MAVARPVDKKKLYNYAKRIVRPQDIPRHTVYTSKAGSHIAKHQSVEQSSLWVRRCKIYAAKTGWVSILCCQQRPAQCNTAEYLGRCNIPMLLYAVQGCFACWTASFAFIILLCESVQEHAGRCKRHGRAKRQGRAHESPRDLWCSQPGQQRAAMYYTEARYELL
jgi:hypothetical protein